MADSNREFERLMEQVGAGSDEAVRELLDKYGPHIMRTIRRKLSRRMRSQFDSTDFYQAVWASFFADESATPRFEREQDLIAFLNRMAGNKVIDECRRRLQGAKHNVNREHNDVEETEEAPKKRDAVPADDPTPSQVIVAKEQMDRMTNGQPSYYQKILQLRADGATYNEIAEDTGVNERTVRRVIKRISARFER